MLRAGSLLVAAACGACGPSPATDVVTTTPAAPAPAVTTCPPGTGEAWTLPTLPPGAPAATFEVRRRPGEYDQPRDGTCVAQGDKTSAVPHGEVGTFAIPAATTALTKIDGWAYVAVPTGETLTLWSDPCTSRDLGGPWFDSYDERDDGDATPPPGYHASELVFVRGACTTATAAAVTRRCTDDEASTQADETTPVVATSCRADGVAAHCRPVTIAQPGGDLARFLLAVGDRFAVCLDDAGAIASTLRLPSSP